MPGSEVVAVVALRRVARERAPVAEVAGGTRCLVLVVPGSGPRARIVAAPGRRVIGREIGGASVLVGKVAERSDRARDLVEKSSGLRGPRARVGDVSGGDERRRGPDVEDE